MADHLVGGLHCADLEDLAASFVLGALEASEADAVRAHLAGCPEPHPEFAELGSVVPALFEAVDVVEPPAALKARILAAAAADTQRAGMPIAEQPRVPGTPQRAERASDPLRGSWLDVFRRPIWAGVAVAAVVAAVALGVGYLGLRTQVDDLTAYRNAVAAVLDEATQPGAQLAVLGAPNATAGPIGFAAVGSDGNVTLAMRDLAPTSGAQVYEAWLIAGKNPPVPIGGFTVSTSGTGTFAAAHAPLGDGVTVALTLEPGPGATTPTLPIIAVGSALGPS